MSQTDGSGAGRSLPPELDPRGRRAARRQARAQPARGGADVANAARGHRNALRGVVLGVRVLAAVLSLIVLVGSGWAWATYRTFTNNIATGSSLPGATGGGKDIDGQDQNILLIGNDSRAGATPAELAQLNTQDDGGTVNTDTIILLHVPADGSKATLISFPRDSYVEIPGHSSGRLNSAYPDAYNEAKQAGKSESDAESAGITLTAATISQLTGLTVDHYLQINLLGFYRISIALGGVDVCLLNPMRPATAYGQQGNGIDAGFEPDGSYVKSYSGINLPAGVSHIEGTQALAFVRQRHGLPGGDLDRIKRQQYFLGAVFRKVSSAGTLLNPFKLNDLLSAVSSSLLKDPGLDLLSLASQVQDLQAGNITFDTIPTTGDETVNGAAVLGVDPDAVKQYVDALIGQKPDTALGSAPLVAPSSVAVTVLNGSGINGAAAANATLLQAAGFQIAGRGDADSTAATVIQYPAGQQSQAKTLAAAVPGAALALTSSVTGVTLILGGNGVAVPDPANPTTAAAAPTLAPTTTAAPARTGADASCIN